MIIFAENLFLLGRYNKISSNLLRYAFFSGLFLCLLVSLPIFFLGITEEGAYLFYFLLFLFPIISTWIYRNRVLVLDFRNSFSVSFLTLFIATFLFAVLMDFKGYRDFNLSQFIFFLPPLMGYSFLLATIFKKEN